jgi:type IV secretory pathway protease TraF
MNDYPIPGYFNSTSFNASSMMPVGLGWNWLALGTPVPLQRGTAVFHAVPRTISTSSS